MEHIAELLPAQVDQLPAQARPILPAAWPNSNQPRMFPALTPARRPTEPCGCDGSGWFLLEVEARHPEFAKLQACQCGRAGAGARDKRLESLRDELAGLAGCTLDSFDLARPIKPLLLGLDANGQEQVLSEAAQRAQLGKALRAARTYASGPIGWLFVHGPPGAGKSHLGAAIALARAAQGDRVIFRSTPGLLDDLRPGGPVEADSVMAAVLGADLLVLDDLGSERLTPWALERIFRITNERKSRPTVITSNLDIDQLEQTTDARVADRLAVAVQVWMPVSSYRRIVRPSNG